jgi:hypothetical protein
MFVAIAGKNFRAAIQLRKKLKKVRGSVLIVATARPAENQCHDIIPAQFL